LSLARYHVLAHPAAPHRLTRLLVLVNGVVASADVDKAQECIVRTYFRNDPAVVIAALNRIIF
jgi:hypothetical protein